MSAFDQFNNTDALDEIFLDVATILELSPEDRRIAENRYSRLKAHLERKGGPLASFMIDGQSLIYAQGSIATSTTIISGTDEDRFDVDAIVEFDVPLDWSDKKPLDLLERALEGFPGVIEIERCTRCIQLRFRSMHMDVTILDRSKRIGGERPGEIFHSPDDAPSKRIPSNPWGFTDWFRSQISVGQGQFVERISKARSTISRSRLSYLDDQERIVIAKADQEGLPPIIPARVDAQEAVALKLLKRFINLHYQNNPLKRPPSIYLTKLTGDFGCVEGGLALQLEYLASFIAQSLRSHMQQGTRPKEVNPFYPPDKINDRWPRELPDGFDDMEGLAGALEYLVGAIEVMNRSSMRDIYDKVGELFGENVAQEQVKVLKKRSDRRKKQSELLLQPGSGKIYSPAIIAPVNEIKSIPDHKFHPMKFKKERCGGKS